MASISNLKFITLTSCLLTAALVVAIVYPDIVSVLVILGGGFGSAHAFVFPALMEFKLKYDINNLWTLQSFMLLCVTATVSVLGFGSVLLVILGY